MRFIIFNTPKPKRFKYKPRYYDEEKERIEQRKAELGLDSELTHKESLRFQMRRRWRHQETNTSGRNLSRFIYFAFYAFVIVGGIYMIFFTDFVNKLVALFGIGR
jgi:hypothetical protein